MQTCVFLDRERPAERATIAEHHVPGDQGLRGGALDHAHRFLDAKEVAREETLARLHVADFVGAHHRVAQRLDVGAVRRRLLPAAPPDIRPVTPSLRRAFCPPSFLDGCA